MKKKRSKMPIIIPNQIDYQNVGYFGASREKQNREANKQDRNQKLLALKKGK